MFSLLPVLLLAPLLLLPSALAANLPITQHLSSRSVASSKIGATFYKGTLKGTVNAAASASSNDTEAVTTDSDLVYIAEIDIAGTSVPVQLDTGSSDLWVKPASQLSSVTQSTVFINMSYGIGYTAGLVARADVQFADYDLPSQAFILASQASNPIFQYGAQGIVGLGFTSLSQVDYSVNATGASWGRSLLYNAFAQKPGEPNFISFVLQRSDDPSDAVQGSLTIGEYVPQYTGIQSMAKLPTVPEVDPSRWQVALDAIETSAGNMTGFTSANPQAPSGKAVALIDSGTSYAYVTPAIAQAIYGSIPNASLNSATSTWSLPCDAQVTLAFWFAGQRIYVHPLDSNRKQSDGTCIGTFLPQSLSVGGSDYDILLGDVFLRNVYSLYDFGDTDSSGNPTAGPYVQFLSITDELSALQDFVSVRGGTVPASVAQATSSLSAPAATGVGSSGGSVSADDDEVGTNIAKLMDYVPALLGLLALNTLFLVALLGIGIFICLRWRKRGGKSSSNSGSSDSGNGGGGGGKAYKPLALQKGGGVAPYDPEAPYSQQGLDSSHHLHADAHSDLEKDLSSSAGAAGPLDPPTLPYGPRHSVFDPRLSMIKGNMSQTSLDQTSIRSGSLGSEIDKDGQMREKAPPSPISPGTTLVATSATDNKRFSTALPSVGGTTAIEEGAEEPGSTDDTGSSGSGGSDPRALITPTNERDSFLAPPVRPFSSSTDNNNRTSLSGLPALPASRPNSMLAPLAGDPVVLLATSTPERNRLRPVSTASSVSVLEPPAPPFAGGAQARRDRSPSPGAGGNGQRASPTQALITLETPEKEHSTLEPPTAAYAQPQQHARNESLSSLPPLPVSRPGSMFIPNSSSEPAQMDQRRLSRLDPPNLPFGNSGEGQQRRASNGERSPSPSPSPTSSSYPNFQGMGDESPSKRSSVLQPPAAPFASASAAGRSGPPNRAMPPRPLSLVDAGAAGPPRPRMLSPRLAENRPTSMFDTAPALQPPPASLRGSRLARASYVPPTGSASQDSLAAQARGFQLRDGPVPSSAGAAQTPAVAENSPTFPGGLRPGQAHARIPSRLAQSSFIPDQQQQPDGLSAVDLQGNGNNNNNRATMFLPPLPASRPGSYYDPSQAPARSQDDLADVFNATGLPHQRHDSGSNGRDGNLVSFFQSGSDDSH